MKNVETARRIVQAIEVAARIAAEHGSHTQQKAVLLGIEALAQIAGDLLLGDLIESVIPMDEKKATA